LEARLDEGPHSRQEALALLDRWWADQQARS